MSDLQKLLSTELDRRRFLKFLGVAAGAVTLEGLLSRCAPRATPTPTPAPLPTPTPTISYAGKVLTAYTFGGLHDESLEKSVAKILETKYGAKIATVPGTSAAIVSKVIAEKASPQADWLSCADFWTPKMRAEDAIEKIDYSKLPSFADLHPRFQKRVQELENYWCPLFITDLGIAYRTDKIKEEITSWEQLWDPKYKGHVTWGPIESAFNYNFLQICAKLAGNEKDIWAGYDKLLTLKPQLLTVTTSLAIQEELLTAGDSWITPMLGGRTRGVVLKGLPVKFVFPKEGALGDISGMAMVKGTKLKGLVEIFFELAISKEGQEAWLALYGYGPVNSKAVLPADVAAYSSVGKEKVEKWIQADYSVLDPPRAEIMERVKRDFR